jgi:predicted phage tail component-like protein
MTKAKYNVWFGGNNLNSIIGVEIFNHNFNDLPTRDIKITKIARRDKSIITSSEYSSKQITVDLDISTGSRADTEGVIKTLKGVLQPQNAILLVTQDGDNTEYVATMNEFNIEWIGVKAVIRIVFIASDPVGRSVITQTLLDDDITTATKDLSVMVAGSAMAYPTFVATIDAVTGGTTNKSITIKNGLTNQGITVTRDWVSGDILSVNSDDLIVKVNNLIVDFTGIFPSFPVGSQQASYVDDFTTRDVHLVATYKPRVI